MLPVVVLSTIDPVVRDSATFAAVVDGPGTVVVRQDLDPVASTLRRVVSDVTGTIEDEIVALQHVCLGCAIREETLPLLELIAGSGRWARIVVALPVSAAAPPLTRALADREIADRIGVRTAGAVTAVDVSTVEHDLVGDDLLDERGLALSGDDRRSVGEALSAQLRHADLLLCSTSDGRSGRVGGALVDHLRGVGSERAELLGDGVELFRPRYGVATERRLDPRRVGPGNARDGDGVWSLDLHSRRPLHPERLMAGIDRLGTGPVCSHGRFLLPGRPGTVAQWDGAGGQLSIGDAGHWAGAAPSTRLVYTGVQHRSDGTLRDRIVETFRSVVMTDAELRTADRWLGVDDGFDPWLGDREQVA